MTQVTVMTGEITSLYDLARRGQDGGGLPLHRNNIRLRILQGSIE
jgi:hypothetical protein